MLLDVYTENYALIGRHELDSAFVPRVGETVIIDDEKHLVHEVEHMVISGKLETLVSCTGSSGPESRHQLLKENGWL